MTAARYVPAVSLAARKVGRGRPVVGAGICRAAVSLFS